MTDHTTTVIGAMAIALGDRLREATEDAADMPASFPAALAALREGGVDPSGGAGVYADIRAFAAFGVFPTAAITSITFQNTQGVAGSATYDDDGDPTAIGVPASGVPAYGPCGIWPSGVGTVLQ